MPLGYAEGWTIPADAPFYPPLPAYYRQVRFQFVFFRADPAAVATFLPAPLEPDPDGLCVAGGLTVPFCTHYGPFDEAFVQQRCSFRGQRGWYCSHVLHTGPAGIAAGREVYGTPKVFAGITVEQTERVMCTSACMAGRPVMTIASTMEVPCSPEEMVRPAPSWRLKLIPRADGPGPAIKQLIDGASAQRDVQVHATFRGTGTVQFAPNPLCDLTPLAPQAYVSAYYLETSFAESYAKIVHDYLAEA